MDLSVLGLLCEAIAAKTLLAFTYEGHPRVVAPYCHGFTRAGDEALRAVQLRGTSRSGHSARGKLWIVSKPAVAWNPTTPLSTQAWRRPT